MEVWVRLSLVHFKGRSRKSSFRTYLDMKLFRSMTDLTPIPGSCQPFRGNESHNVDSSHRLAFQAFPLVRVDAFNHDKSLRRLDGFHSIYPCCFLALIVLRHPTDCEHSGCSGFHQEFLKCVDCSVIATLFSLKDALLYAVHMLLKLTPGHLAPTLTLRLRRCFPLAPGCLRFWHTTCASFFHVIVPTSAYPAAFPLALAS